VVIVHLGLFLDLLAHRPKGSYQLGTNIVTVKAVARKVMEVNMAEFLLSIGGGLSMLLVLTIFCRARVRRSERDLSDRIQYRLEAIDQARRIPLE
jgi:hypothetical protein